MSTPTANRRAQPGGWLFLVLAVVLAVGAAFSWRQNASTGGRPNGFGDVDPNDPSRFKVVADGVLEDTATGIRQNVPNLKIGDNSVEALAALEKLLATNADFRPDLRDGRGPRPVRLVVKNIGVNAEVVPIGLDTNRALLVPRSAAVTGWWSGGNVPGEFGPTVIVGHFDSKVAPGVFEHLREIDSAAKISVEMSDGSSYVYVVSGIERLHKTAFPTDKVYGATGRSVLRLVTCGGQFDSSTHHYVDNVIVYADLASFVPGTVPPTTPFLAPVDDGPTALGAYPFPIGPTIAGEVTTTVPPSTATSATSATATPATTVTAVSTVASTTTIAGPATSVGASTTIDPIISARTSVPGAGPSSSNVSAVATAGPNTSGGPTSTTETAAPTVVETPTNGPASATIPVNPATPGASQPGATSTTTLLPELAGT